MAKRHSKDGRTKVTDKAIYASEYTAREKGYKISVATNERANVVVTLSKRDAKGATFTFKGSDRTGSYPLALKHAVDRMLAYENRHDHK